MDRKGHDNVVYFVGSEVEFTPAYSMRTLFVVGIQDADEIIRTAQKHECRHIYLGANQSFEPSDDWDILVKNIVKHKDFMVTLDFDVVHCEWVLEGGYDEHDGATLHWMDYMASYSKVDFGAHGYAANFIISIFDREFKHNMNLDQAKDIMKKCLHELKTRFLISQPVFIIKIIDKDGVRVIDL